MIAGVGVGTKQRSKSAVIKPQFGDNAERFTTSRSLCSREQDLFLHTNVLEQARTKRGISGTVDLTRMSSSALEQGIEACMVVGQKAGHGSRHGGDLLVEDRSTG
jgi:hypothetical protein